MNKVFAFEHPIRFGHCDPAGVVYFPWFLDMINNTCEEWYERSLSVRWSVLHLQDRYGIPVVNTKVDFLSPCHYGERITMELAVAHLGRSSLEYRIVGRVGDSERLRARHKVVMTSLDTHRPIAIPAEMRAGMLEYAIDPAPPAAPSPATHDGKVPPNAFRTPYLIRFSHCDPAGIGFYPRYFDLFNSAVEDWFQTGLECPWGTEFMLVRNLRIPSLSITVEFLRACRMGETLEFAVWVTKLGRSSVQLALSGLVGGQEHMRVAWALCVIDFATFKSTPIPDDLRERMTRYLRA